MSHAKGPARPAFAPRSKLYKGRFGRICPGLTPWAPPGVPPEQIEAHFVGFANEHMTERPGLSPGEANDIADELEAEFSSDIPAGYTYFGQFVDHDITFDPTPLGVELTDPEGLENFRTPRLDLDCVYGSGPHDQPYMYDGAGKFLIGEIPGTGLADLPRNPLGRAIIGDMRNDENAIVSQIQLAFLTAHNTLVDRAVAAGKADPFMEARRVLTWLYQHCVWHDFIRRVCIDEVVDTALQKDKGKDGRVQWSLGLKDVYSWEYNPYMPLEFAVAAYRFGHSMVRNGYQTNFTHNALDRVPLFNNTTSGPGADEPDLRGFGPRSPVTTVQWDWFFDMGNEADFFPQMARKIDTKLANALLFLGEDDGDPASVANKLAARNLIRGVMMELPSGPDMAAKLNVPVTVTLSDGEPAALWYYILKEAEGQGGARLGRLGSTIVSAVFAGLLKGDPKAYVNVDPGWSPEAELASGMLTGDDKQDNPDWGLQAILRISGQPVSGV
ncbi:peroxidase family protein [Vannielia litorea]|uniref:peroxidase family protein n=1 Tax=Vannielia litorea TaxID=1217970 RepID=UPI001BCC3AC3|nr:peroxidase family protein [Vannielia litorea]MBS8228539.1 peroxidase [Vannielia litorea]